MGDVMPVYKISKEDRCKIFKLTSDLHDRAQLLMALAHDDFLDAQAQRARLLRLDTPENELPPLPPVPSWYHACKAIDPSVDFGKFFFLIDCADGDHGTHLTITVSNKVAGMLRRELGIELEFVHAVHHRPQDFPA
ncbi:hypothetical protein ACVWXO_008122 [Bradyrhizobium sp. LM2.7]